MKNDDMTCDAQRIELFLKQQLSDEEQAAFESHLGDCEDCRHRLEATAADGDIWVEVRKSLSSGPRLLDCPQPGDSALDAARGSEAGVSRATVLQLLTPTDDDRAIGRLGPYEVVGVIGSGGMGVLLKAFDAALDRYVAIKVLAPHLGSSGAARKRFAREAQAAAAVVHDNVIEILRIAKQAASGLAAAHAQGLVHRDVKPANILLADGVERVKLTDFGLARAADDASLTKTGIIAGTPQYMSPEQARGESVDARGDLFSLGSVMYAMGTGHPPFRAETSYGILRRITDTEPRPIREINPEIPGWLAALIDELHAKDPADRIQSAAELAQILEGCLAHVQQPTAMPLPESVQSFMEKTSPPAESCKLSLSGRDSWPRRNLGWPGPFVAAAFVGAALAVAAIIGVAIRDGAVKDDGPMPSSASATDVPSSSERLPHVNAESASARWGDGVAEQIIQLEEGIDRLEIEAGRLWDGQIPSSRSGTGRRTIQPSEKESTQ